MNAIENSSKRFSPRVRDAALTLSRGLWLVAALSGLVGCAECATDDDCKSGEVCEVAGSAQAVSLGHDAICVPGCHDDSQCGDGHRCQAVQCIAPPCPGQCVGDELCTVDSDCAPGSVCELSTGCEQPTQCVPGCRDDTACAPGLHCEQPLCLTCPCPGFCVQ